MDTNTLNDECSEYIYSDEYLGYLVRYDNDIKRVYDVFEPACISIINTQFLVAYTRREGNELEEMLRYGYESVPKCYGLMDTTAVEDTGATRLKTLPGLNLSGNGVLVGFVDTGIDYTSSAFRRANGNSRIDYIWDQNEEVYGFGRSVYGYGAEFSRLDIDRALQSDTPYSIVPTRDENGHGTFLASVAAGRENADRTFTGVSPEASIAVVKLRPAKRALRDFYLINGDSECFGEDDIILGIKYLVQVAELLGKPLVICLGIGSNQGGHDGNTYLEAYIDMISRLRAVCVVTPTGNELGFGTHFSRNYELNSGGDTSEDYSRIEVAVSGNNKGFSMEIWGKSPGILRIRVLSPTGELFSGVQPLVSGTTRKNFIYEGTDLFVENVVVERISGNPFIFLRFSNPAEGIWTIIIEEFSSVKGQGYNAWLPIQEFLNGETRFVRPDPNITITSPGNGRQSITVAGYNHLNDALYVNSGRGYTVNNTIKPELTAPAVNVYGVFASGGDRELYNRRSGTSIAASLTAGAVALILEWAVVKGNDKSIEAQDIKQMLIRGVKRVTDIIYPNPSWGYGVLDVYGAFAAMREIFENT